MTALEQGWALFVKGGAMMYPILACSVYTLAVGLERWGAFRRAGRDDGLERRVAEALRAGERGQALALCREGGAVAAVLARGLEYHRPGRVAALRDVLEGAAAAETAALRRRLGHLATIVTAAPLLGLLGTVVGMMKTFNVLAAAAGRPAAVTGGVGEALIATAAGLGVAILALLIHSYYTARLEELADAMEAAANGLIAALEGGGGHEAGEPAGGQAVCDDYSDD